MSYNIMLIGSSYANTENFPAPAVPVVTFTPIAPGLHNLPYAVQIEVLFPVKGIKEQNVTFSLESDQKIFTLQASGTVTNGHGVMKTSLTILNVSYTLEEVSVIPSGDLNSAVLQAIIPVTSWDWLMNIEHFIYNKKTEAPMWRNDTMGQVVNGDPQSGSIEIIYESSGSVSSAMIIVPVNKMPPSTPQENSQIFGYSYANKNPYQALIQNGVMTGSLLNISVNKAKFYWDDDMNKIVIQSLSLNATSKPFPIDIWVQYYSS